MFAFLLLGTIQEINVVECSYVYFELKPMRLLASWSSEGIIRHKCDPASLFKCGTTNDCIHLLWRESGGYLNKDTLLSSTEGFLRTCQWKMSKVGWKIKVFCQTYILREIKRRNMNASKNKKFIVIVAMEFTLNITATDDPTPRQTKRGLQNKLKGKLSYKNSFDFLHIWRTIENGFASILQTLFHHIPLQPIKNPTKHLHQTMRQARCRNDQIWSMKITFLVKTTPTSISPQ